MPHGQRLGFAMNAGMYHEDRSPVGLYIQDGIEYQRIITSDGPGNFGLLPNGVLCWTDRAAHIVESRAFAAAPPVCDYATQSGPMLVIAGDLHPRFLEHGTSLHIRNGVGIGPQGRHLYFVISENPVNFHHFGRFFRDHLNLDTALYLDGRVSRLYAPDLGWSGFGWWRLGPVIGTVTGPALDAPASGG
jgi:uncharacterized protein YigE (DUF2233 family)